MMETILLVDDDQELSDVLCLVLEAQGYRTLHAANASDALELVSNEDLSLILLDLRLGKDNGLDLVRPIREMDPEVPVFVITAHGDVETAVSSFTLGANGYIRKPFQEGELLRQIRQSIDSFRIKRDLRARPSLTGGEAMKNLIRSRDPVMEPLFRKLAIAAKVSSSVVIHGESGTGKELVARALHQFGPRQQGPFVAINCAAIPENLLESELFGHMRGAFTDARENKPGLFVRANGGTLFLDEIADAPLSIQTKLLRVLQEKEVLPVGGQSPIKIDVRIVSASHKSLSEEVALGRFRQDLYYRLHVLPIHVPPLRARPRDIVFLASLFASRVSEEVGIRFGGFAPSTISALENHSWPGNVRELQNRVEHAVITSGGAPLSVRCLFPERESREWQESGAREENVPCPGDASVSAATLAEEEALMSYSEAKNTFERNYLERVLGLARGNIARAAKLASKSRTEVYNLLRKHRLDPETFKRSSESISD